MSDDARTGTLVARRTAGSAGILAVMVFTGVVLAPLTDPASKGTRPRRFSFAAADARELATEGLLVSAGSLRTLAADAAWLRAYIMTERSDRGSCAAYARLACALAPDNPAFREGYANWLAYDFPHWTIRSLGGFDKVPKSVSDGIFKADANAAMDYLKAEMRRDPDEFRYPMVASEISVIKFRDPDLAASYDRQAAETPAAPWAPALRYARRLAETGRLREAVDWLSAYAARRPEGSMAREVAEEWLTPARERLKLGTPPAAPGTPGFLARP